MAKAAYPTIGIAALVMFGIVYFIGCLRCLLCIQTNAYCTLVVISIKKEQPTLL